MYILSVVLPSPFHMKVELQVQDLFHVLAAVLSSPSDLLKLLVFLSRFNKLSLYFASMHRVDIKLQASLAFRSISSPFSRGLECSDCANPAKTMSLPIFVEQCFPDMRLSPNVVPLQCFPCSLEAFWFLINQK